MDKIALIISREYLSRVKKKSFVIMTFLGPLLFAGIAIAPTWLATRESTDEKLVKVIDQSGIVAKNLEDESSVRFEIIAESLEDALENLEQYDEAAVLHIPQDILEGKSNISFYSYHNPGVGIKKTIERKVRQELENVKLLNSGIKKEALEELKVDLAMSTFNLSEKGEASESSTEASLFTGYISSFLIYFFIFFYGAQILRGVIEEKTSRVIEVIISSVKPFQLMMGKIIGVGAVGLSQFILWVALSFGIVTLGMDYVLKDVDEEKIEQVMAAQAGDSPVKTEKGQEIVDAIFSINYPLILGCFIFYFLGGYLLYGALFAAVGSAVDSDADSQQFMLPITIPLIFSIVIIGAVINEPHGQLAFWTSIIPFTAPVVMMMRIPFDVPVWEIALSMSMVIGGFLFTTWFASRIYRIGIFMHGTKVNYKTLSKWFMMKI